MGACGGGVGLAEMETSIILLYDIKHYELPNKHKYPSAPPPAFIPKPPKWPSVKRLRKKAPMCVLVVCVKS